MRLQVGILLAFGGACGSGAAAVDGGPSDGVPQRDATCQVPAGRGYVLSHLAVLPEGEGLDITGDGAVDNELGRMPDSTLASVNDGLAEMLSLGTFLAGALVTDWSDPPTPDDPAVGFQIMHLFDEDRPPDPANNYGGEGRFTVHQDAFDLSCNPDSAADQASIAAGVLTARRSRWAFELSTGSGQLEFEDVTIVGTFDETYLRADATLGAVMPFCSLASLAIPGEIPGSVLDAIVNDAGLAGPIAVDVDLDGDGFEQVVGDGVGILRCQDGDGTVIEGADCVCHPSIVDGYTVGVEVEIVYAMMVAVVP